METIRLNSIEKNNNTIKFDFEYTEGLAKYFSNRPFLIEYPFSVETVPDSIAAVPFVCNVLPIVWLTNSNLMLKELDKAFYESIPDFKQGYINMFPESEFLGELDIEQIIECDIPSECKTATFFSGGLDAVNTLVLHIEEKPELISIWGSDIRCDNTSGWNLVHDKIASTAREYNLNDVVIKSAFREFDNEKALHKTFSEQLKNGWWHGVKHGIGLLGHAAPYAYVKRISTIYIASSNCPIDENIRCASHPTIDNYVRFGNTKIVHDGFEFSRQDKAHNVVKYAKEHNRKISVRVCWETQTGNNCCHCEKCYRTMFGIIGAGADPVEYGFFDAPKYIPYARKFLIGEGNLDAAMAKRHWAHIYNAFEKNSKLIKNMPYWNDVKWVLKCDFLHPETIKKPRKTIREWLSGKQFYQNLHKIKIKFIK